MPLSSPAAQLMVQPGADAAPLCAVVATTPGLREQCETSQRALDVIRKPWFQAELAHDPDEPDLRIVNTAQLPPGLDAEAFRAAAEFLVTRGPSRSQHLLEPRELPARLPSGAGPAPGPAFGLFAKVRQLRERCALNSLTPIRSGTSRLGRPSASSRAGW